MKIECDLSGADNILASLTERIEAEMVRTLSYAADDLLTEIRDRPAEQSWEDQTGNLRASTGWAIARNGAIVKTSTFAPVRGKDGTMSQQGQTDGEAYVREIASGLSAEWALILVAGMDYAAYVEAKDNKWVLSSAILKGQKTVPEALAKLAERIKTM